MMGGAWSMLRSRIIIAGKGQESREEMPGFRPGWVKAAPAGDGEFLTMGEIRLSNGKGNQDCIRPPAVVLAAGEGRRLTSGRRPKPMTPLLGLGLLERVLYTLRDGGVRQIVVVLGYEAERVRSWLNERRIMGVDLRVVVNPHWKKGNAGSLASARGQVAAERFLLVMGDHVLDPEIIRELIHERPPAGGAVMAVDRRLDGPHIDPADATKVFIDDARVVAVGKTLPDARAVDIGVMLCSRTVLEEAERRVAEGAEELAEIMHGLAEQGRVRAYDVTGKFWCDVDNPAMLHRARRLLLRRLWKPTDGPVARWFNRRISSWITERAVEWRRWGPNHFSVLAFILAMTGSLLLALRRPAADILAALLVQAASIVDGCDGEIARLRHQSTPFGAWLDRFLDRYSDGALILLVTYRVFIRIPSVWTWFLGGATVIAVLTSSYLAIPIEAVPPKRWSWTTFRLGRDVRFLAACLGILFGRFQLLLWVLFALGHFEVFRRLHRMKIRLQSSP